jgi:hypothetical protein
VKFDDDGNVQWQKTYGGSNDDVAYAVRATPDGGYVVAGSTNSSNGDITGNHGGGDFWLVKINSTGVLQWQKCYGGSSGEQPYGLDLTDDGGYVIAGGTASSDGDITGNHSSGDYLVIKTDATGNLEWEKTYGGSSYDVAHGLKQCADGGYIVAGFARSNDGDVLLAYGQEDMWILKLDEAGNLLWQKTYGGTGGEGAQYLQQTTDGGYILAGLTHSFNIDVVGNHGNAHDFWVVKIDAEGNKQWTRCLGGTLGDDAFWVRQTGDNGYLVCGKSNSSDGDATFNNGSDDFWIVKLNESGTILWQKSLGGSQHDEANAVLETTDGNFVAVGFSDSNDSDVTGNHGSDDMWIVKCQMPTANTFFIDVDGDSYGSTQQSITGCVAPEGYVSNSSDCNDGNAAIHPGAVEVCNGIDEDCDSFLDEDMISAMISPLATLTICETSTLTLSADTASSYSYQWKKNGSNISGATNSIYSTSKAGTYSVLITEGPCSANSPGTIVKIADTTISVMPEGKTTVCPGVAVGFSVAESPGIEYQWYYNSLPIAGETTKNCSAGIPGIYYVIETDITGCHRGSTTATLANYTAATATISASGDLNICNTGSVTFNGTSKPGYTYEWYKDQITIPGATTANYTATQAGVYKYLATTAKGCTKFSPSKTVKSCKMIGSTTENTGGRLAIYPNPCDRNFHCSLELSETSTITAKIKVYDLAERLVQSQEIMVNDGILAGNVTLPPGTLPGLYLVRISTGNNEFIERIEVAY